MDTMDYGRWSEEAEMDAMEDDYGLGLLLLLFTGYVKKISW